ncbi:MAG: extracellular solute-binding protein [Micropepsaceae bacterium]
MLMSVARTKTPILGYAAIIAAGALMASCTQENTPAEFEMGEVSERTASLVEAARAEGSVAVYSSLPVPVMSPVAAAFREKYGIETSIWRGGSEEILQRSVTEARAGRHMVDVVETASPEVEGIAREQLLQIIDSPVFDELMEGSVSEGRAWIYSRLIVFVGAYNTARVSLADAPQSFEDLLDPKWNGRLTVEANDFGWIKGMANALGEDEATSLLRNIVDANGVGVRDGHGLITNMLASGEVEFTFTQYYEQAANARDQGAPIEIAFLDPVIAVPTGIAMFRNAPHPNAAMLFIEFFLSEGQEILAEFDYIGSNLSRQSLPEGMNPVVVEMSDYLDEYQKWHDLHRDIFAAQRR